MSMNADRRKAERRLGDRRVATIPVTVERRVGGRRKTDWRVV
jgi:hypothetical protein